MNETNQNRFIDPDGLKEIASGILAGITNGVIKDLYIGYIDLETSLPSNPVRSSFALVEDCVITNPGYSGLAIFNGSNWDIILIKERGIAERELVGVAGTLERRSSVTEKVITRIKFIPNEGKIDSIDEDGVWICPKTGLYSISSFYGTLAENSDTTMSGIRIKSAGSDVFDTVSEATLTGKNKYINIVSYQGKIEKGDMVDFTIYLNNKQNKPPVGFSSFSIAPISLHI